MASWSGDGVFMLRQIINDADSGSYTYSNSRLQSLMLVAARHVIQDMPLFGSLNIDVMANTLSPDPFASGTKNDDLSNFIVLKAACLADQATYRTRSQKAGKTWKDAQSSLSYGGDYIKSWQVILETGPCKLYDELKFEYQLGNATAIKGIFGPFSGPNVNSGPPTDLI